MAAGGRFEVTQVSGHIDGTGKIAEIKEDSLAIWVHHRSTATDPSIYCRKRSDCH